MSLAWQLRFSRSLSKFQQPNLSHFQLINQLFVLLQNLQVNAFNQYFASSYNNVLKDPNRVLGTKKRRTGVLGVGLSREDMVFVAKPTIKRF